MDLIPMARPPITRAAMLSVCPQEDGIPVSLPLMEMSSVMDLIPMARQLIIPAGMEYVVYVNALSSILYLYQLIDTAGTILR
jgi:hypothetical protein